MYYTTFFVGTAGSGKSTLANVYSEWLGEQNIDVATVNLDPGARYIPYTPDVDIREYVVLEDVMDAFNLGPNGGLVACVDMTVNFIEEIKREIDDLGATHVLVDTPGQLELFAFRESGPIVTSSLGGAQSAVCFLMDPFLARTPYGFVSVMLLGASIQYRFFLPQLNILSKSDILTDRELQKIVDWVSEPRTLMEAIERETQGMKREMSLSICEALAKIHMFDIPIPVSSTRLEGLDNLQAALERIYTGGELAK
ncbi:MAG: ATP/GTP-binding protein [Candidatus Jordarchaeales archaeon]|nr:ATP/GTP-binding protein [Candidatus Jordarchaeia archaeon]